MVEDTEHLLTNTKRFLDGLASDDEYSRRYVENLKETLENELRRQKSEDP